MPGKARSIQVHRVLGNGRKRLVAVRWSTGLKQALIDHYEETLSKSGWVNPLYSGNLLTCDDSRMRGAPNGQWVATEAK